MVLMSFHALSSSWVHSNLEFSALGVNLETLLLLNVVSKVIGGDLAKVLRVRHSIEALPKLSALLICRRLHSC